MLKLSFKFLGSLIGGAIAMKQGKSQIAEGEKKLKASEGLFPEMEDPEQRLALNRIQNRADSYYTGSFASALKDELSSTYSSVTEGALSLASGGGADATALMRQGNALGNAYNKTLATIEGQGAEYQKMAQEQRDSIIQRALELQLLGFQNARYDALATKQTGEMNRQAGRASVIGGIDDMINTGISLATAGLGGKKSSDGGRRI